MRPIDDPITFTVLTEIRAIEQLAEQQLSRALPPGLALSHFAVLNHISSTGVEKSPTQLARVFHLTKGAMTNTIMRLERAGLVRIRVDPKDGRRKLVSPTEAGLEVRHGTLSALSPTFASIAAGVGSEAMRQSLPALRALRMHLSAEAHRNKDAPP